MSDVKTIKKLVALPAEVWGRLFAEGHTIPNNNFSHQYYIKKVLSFKHLLEYINENQLRVLFKMMLQKVADVTSVDVAAISEALEAYNAEKFQSLIKILDEITDELGKVPQTAAVELEEVVAVEEG